MTHLAEGFKKKKKAKNHYQIITMMIYKIITKIIFLSYSIDDMVQITSIKDIKISN